MYVVVLNLNQILNFKLIYSVQHHEDPEEDGHPKRQHEPAGEEGLERCVRHEVTQGREDRQGNQPQGRGSRG